MSSIPIDENQERDVTDANGHPHEPSHEKTQNDETKISSDPKVKQEQDENESEEKITDEETSDKHVVLSPTRRIRKLQVSYIKLTRIRARNHNGGITLKRIQAYKRI